MQTPYFLLYDTLSAIRPFNPLLHHQIDRSLYHKSTQDFGDDDEGSPSRRPAAKTLLMGKCQLANVLFQRWQRRQRRAKTAGELHDADDMTTRMATDDGEAAHDRRNRDPLTRTSMIMMTTSGPHYRRHISEWATTKACAELTFLLPCRIFLPPPPPPAPRHFIFELTHPFEVVAKTRLVRHSRKFCDIV